MTLEERMLKVMTDAQIVPKTLVTPTMDEKTKQMSPKMETIAGAEGETVTLRCRYSTFSKPYLDEYSSYKQNLKIF